MKKGQKISTTGKMWILRLAERAGGIRKLASNIGISHVMLWKIISAQAGLSEAVCASLIAFSEGVLNADDFYQNSAFTRNRVLSYIFMPFLSSLKKPKTADLAEAFQTFIDYLYDGHVDISLINTQHIDALSHLFRIKKSFIKKLLTKDVDIL